MDNTSQVDSHLSAFTSKAQERSSRPKRTCRQMTDVLSQHESVDDGMDVEKQLDQRTIKIKERNKRCDAARQSPDRCICERMQSLYYMKNSVHTLDDVRHKRSAIYESIAVVRLFILKCHAS